LEIQSAWEEILGVVAAGVIPGINKEHMKLKVKLGVPHSVQGGLDLQAVKSVFP
jgi:hypothetical protein